jgi:uncharacterized coiled-coil protein SlyX
MPKLMNFLSPQKRLIEQQQTINELTKEVAQLRAQNNSMRAGMRRCTTCDYRIDFKKHQATDR